MSDNGAEQTGLSDPVASEHARNLAHPRFERHPAQRLGGAVVKIDGFDTEHRSISVTRRLNVDLLYPPRPAKPSRSCGAAPEGKGAALAILNFGSRDIASAARESHLRLSCNPPQSMRYRPR